MSERIPTAPLLVQWQAYDRLIVPGDAPGVQREECRRAFYAGAFAMFQLVIAACDHPDVDDNLGEERLKAFEQEARLVVDDLRIEPPAPGVEPRR